MVVFCVCHLLDISPLCVKAKVGSLCVVCTICWTFLHCVFSSARWDGCVVSSHQGCMDGCVV